VSRNKDLWFPFYWNDYCNDTTRLTMLQHGAYLKCMLEYYRSGAPLPSDIQSVFLAVNTRSADEEKAVVFVLEHFFKKQSDGSFGHSRIESERQNTEERRRLAVESGSKQTEKKAAAARENGKHGGRPKNQTKTEQEPNEEPNGSVPENRTKTELAEQQHNRATTQQSSNRAEQEQSAATKQTSSKSTACLPAQPSEKSQTEQGGPEGRPSGGCLKDVPSSSKAPPSSIQKKTEKERWIEFVTDKKADLPETMKHAQPTDEERSKVLAQLDAIVLSAYALKSGTTKAEYLGMAICDWEETQSPPLRTLAYGRWKRWLETGDPNA